MSSIGIITYKTILQDAVNLGPSIPYAFIYESLLIGKPIQKGHRWAVGPAQQLLRWMVVEEEVTDVENLQA